MHKDTVAEIVIFGGLAVFAVWLWLANKAAGAGTGLESLPGGLATAGAAAAPSGSTLGAVAPVAGDTFTYTGAPVPLAPLQSACNCPSGSTGILYGSLSDLLAALSATSGPDTGNLATAATSLAYDASQPGTGVTAAQLFAGDWN